MRKLHVFCWSMVLLAGAMAALAAEAPLAAAGGLVPPGPLRHCSSISASIRLSAKGNGSAIRARSRWKNTTSCPAVQSRRSSMRPNGWRLAKQAGQKYLVSPPSTTTAFACLIHGSPTTTSCTRPSDATSFKRAGRRMPPPRACGWASIIRSWTGIIPIRCPGGRGKRIAPAKEPTTIATWTTCRAKSASC